MLYTILCYKPGGVVEAWSKEHEDAVMTKLFAVEQNLAKAGKLGPVARLKPAATAKTLRKSTPPMVIDGPFAETKEHLLGFYVVDCKTEEEALNIARDLADANPGGSYEIRPVLLFHPGTAAAMD